MESSTATHPGAKPAIDADAESADLKSKSQARRRDSVLARMLFVGDFLAALTAAAVAVLIMEGASLAALAFVVCAGCTLATGRVQHRPLPQRPARRLGLGRG